MSAARYKHEPLSSNELESTGHGLTILKANPLPPCSSSSVSRWPRLHPAHRHQDCVLAVETIKIREPPPLNAESLLFATVRAGIRPHGTGLGDTGGLHLHSGAAGSPPHRHPAIYGMNCDAG